MVEEKSLYELREEYKDNPYELANIPDEVFEKAGILNKAEYVANAIGTYEQLRDRYKPNVGADPAGSAKTFWKNLENFKVNKLNFHKAFDAELDKLHLLDVFNKDGDFKGKETYHVVEVGYFSNPDNEAAKALFLYWKNVYDRRTEELNGEDLLRVRTAEVKEELEKLGITKTWTVKGELIAAHRDKVIFEYDEPGIYTIVTIFRVDAIAMTSAEVALAVKERYETGHYTETKFLDY